MSCAIYDMKRDSTDGDMETQNNDKETSKSKIRRIFRKSDISIRFIHWLSDAQSLSGKMTSYSIFISSKRLLDLSTVDPIEIAAKRRKMIAIFAILEN